MGNLSTLAREALRQVEGASNTKRILVSRKIICDLERQPNEVSLRVCADLRKVLLSVTSDPEASPDQTKDAKGLMIRVRSINPRNLRDDDKASIEELESTNRRPATPDPEKYVRPVAPKPPREPDGYDPSFIEGGIDGAIARLIAKGYTPNMLIKQEEAFLQTALGPSRTLDPKAAEQLWLGLQYAWKEKWNKVSPPMAVRLQTALCGYHNSLARNLPPGGGIFHEADCLSFVETLEIQGL